MNLNRKDLKINENTNTFCDVVLLYRKALFKCILGIDFQNVIKINCRENPFAKWWTKEEAKINLQMVSIFWSLQLNISIHFSLIPHPILSMIAKTRIFYFFKPRPTSVPQAIIISRRYSHAISYP